MNFSSQSSMSKSSHAEDYTPLDILGNGEGALPVPDEAGNEEAGRPQDCCKCWCWDFQHGCKVLMRLYLCLNKN